MSTRLTVDTIQFFLRLILVLFMNYLLMRSPKHVLGKYLCHFLFTLWTAILNLGNPLSDAATAIAMITRIKSNFFLYSHIIETYGTSVLIDLFRF